MILHRYYFISAMLLFAIEVLIALYVRDTLIRPYGGDFLVVMFLYCLVRAVTLWNWNRVAAGVLILAYIMEIGQYLDVLKILGFDKSGVVGVVIGSRFEWGDMFAYTLGIAVVVLFENRKRLLQA